jgi:hypothetical protein
MSYTKFQSKFLRVPRHEELKYREDGGRKEKGLERIYGRKRRVLIIRLILVLYHVVAFHSLPVTDTSDVT